MNPKQLGDDKERKNCLSPKDKNKSPTKRKYKKVRDVVRLTWRPKELSNNVLPAKSTQIIHLSGF